MAQKEQDRKAAEGAEGAGKSKLKQRRKAVQGWAVLGVAALVVMVTVWVLRVGGVLLAR